MKVIIKIKRSPEQYFLVSLVEEGLANEVKNLIERHKHSKAVVTALSKGRFEKELAHDELLSADADLILTEYNAMWDLVK